MTSPDEYLLLWEHCALTPDPLRLRVLDYLSRVAMTNRSFYESVEELVNVPWPIVAAIHARDREQNFRVCMSGRKLGDGEHWPKVMAKHLMGNWAPEWWTTAAAVEFLDRFAHLGHQGEFGNSTLWGWTNRASDSPGSPPGYFAILKAIENRFGVPLDFAALTALNPSLH